MNSPTFDEMISVNCCFFPFVWCGRRVCLCVSDVMNTHTELHSMCLCNLYFCILFSLSTLTFLCRFSLPLIFFHSSSDERVFSDFSSNKCFSFARVFFSFNSQAVCLTYSFLWSSSHLHLCEKCQAVIKLFFFSLWRMEMWVCLCVRFYFVSIYEYIWILVRRSSAIFYFCLLACSSVCVVFVVSLFLWSCVLQMERMLFRKFTPRHRVNIHTFVYLYGAVSSWCLNG